MTKEEKITALENWCKHYESKSAINFCLGCPIDEICTMIEGKFDEQHPVEVESAYSIIYSNEIKDEAHKRFMNIGEDDKVNHPAHYTQNGIECIAAIRASMTSDGFCDYCKGNIIKYLWRWRDKGGVQDLEKAKVYLDWLIEAAKGCQNGQE